jgi:hypothetical protein
MFAYLFWNPYQVIPKNVKDINWVTTNFVLWPLSLGSPLDTLGILSFPLKMHRRIWFQINKKLYFYPSIDSRHDLHCRWPQRSWTGSRKISEHIRQRNATLIISLFFASKPTILSQYCNIQSSLLDWILYSVVISCAVHPKIRSCKIKINSS